MGALGLEPRTYGLKVRKAENVTHSKTTTYNTPENHLTVNLTGNDNADLRDLQKLINCWHSLPQHIKNSIKLLIDGEAGRSVLQDVWYGVPIRHTIRPALINRLVDWQIGGLENEKTK